MNTRIFNLESTVSEIKDTMVTKEDLKELKDELIPAIKDAAKYDVVKNTVTINWRGVLLFFGAVVLASFGVRGLDFLTKLMEKLL